MRVTCKEPRPLSYSKVREDLNLAKDAPQKGSGSQKERKQCLVLCWPPSHVCMDVKGCSDQLMRGGQKWSQIPSQRWGPAREGARCKGGGR